MSSLAQQHCVPCQGGVPPLAETAARDLLARLEGGWSLAGGKLEKEYRFPSFQANIAFLNRVAAVAEVEGHHPEMQVGFRTLKLSIWTHKISGLTESDFILAAKADAVLIMPR